MDKVYVVTGTTGSYEETDETIRYAGTDKDKAFGYMPTDCGYTHSLQMEIWVDGKQVKGYYKGVSDNEEWKVNFDRVEELRSQLEHNRKTLEETEKELKELSSLL